MDPIKPKINDLSKAWSSPVQTIEWIGLGAEQVGEPVETSGANVKSVQVFGAFGDGAVVYFEGSNDGTHWVPLKNAFGGVIDIGSDGLYGVSEATRCIRPLVHRGDKRTLLNVVILLRRESK
jgi:hypothetical protein